MGVEICRHLPRVTGLGERRRDGLRPLLEGVPHAAADGVAMVGHLGAEVAEQAATRETVPLGFLSEELEVGPEPDQ
jgi:hypothetical protein